MPARKAVTLTLDEGLHMRPCSMLQARAAAFPGDVRLSSGGRTADVKSIFDLLGLGLARGSECELEADGEGADALVAALATMFDNDFAPETTQPDPAAGTGG